MGGKSSSTNNISGGIGQGGQSLSTTEALFYASQNHLALEEDYSDDDDLDSLNGAGASSDRYLQSGFLLDPLQETMELGDGDAAPANVSYDIAVPRHSSDEEVLDESPDGDSFDDSRLQWQDMLTNVLHGSVLKSEKSRMLAQTLTNGPDASFEFLQDKQQRAYAIWLHLRARSRGRTVEEETSFLDEARGQINRILESILVFRVKGGDAGGAGAARSVEAGNAGGAPALPPPSASKATQAPPGHKTALHSPKKSRSRSPRVSRNSSPKVSRSSSRTRPEAGAEASTSAQLPPTSLPPTPSELPPDPMSSATFQVRNVLRRFEWCESLYPSSKALMLAKDQVAQDAFNARLTALRSWQSITERLKMMIGILQRLTGDDWEMLSTLEPTQRNRRGERSTLMGFVEIIARDDKLEETFRKRTMSDIFPLVALAKATMFEQYEEFRAMNLPSYVADLKRLAVFPSRLAQEAVRIRLASLANLNDPSPTLIDQLSTGLRKVLSTACAVKERYHELSHTDDAEIWYLPPTVDEYEETLLSALRFFFKLLHWKLKSPSKAIYFKETEIVENEWNFLRSATEQIEGGDLLVGEHVCTLTHRLLVRVMTYFEMQLQILETRDMSPKETFRWFTQTLDNVRTRHRKLLRFGKTMLQRLENSAEYYLDHIDLARFMEALCASGYFIIYTDLYEKEGVYFVGSPKLYNRPEMIRNILTRALNGASLSTDHVLVLTPHEPFLWPGKIMHVDVPRVDFDLRDKRLRLVTNTTGLQLSQALAAFHAMFPAFETNLISASRAHLAKVNREIKKIGRAVFRLAETILGSINRVRKVARYKADRELLENYFHFAADLGRRSIKYLDDSNVQQRFSYMLMQFGISWIAFICDDCAPSDPRTFKWAVQALEFAMDVTQHGHVLQLDAADFALLRTRVASCMTLLISHFDILGARSYVNGQENTYSGSRVKIREMLSRRIASLDLDEGDAPRAEQDSARLSAERLAALEAIEAKRSDLQRKNKTIGRILESPNEDSLRILASFSSSSIQIQWRQGKFIGGGTFGNVYLAMNLETGADLAVKEIRFQDVTTAPRLLQSIQDEMKVMELLRHENIVEYYGVEIHRDRVYIFEEYCAGGSLANVLAEHGRVEEEIVIQAYATQMLSGLIYLHSRNIVHRDIKPDNVLLDTDGIIKLVDFGAAKMLAKKQQKDKTLKAASDNYNEQSLIGTPMYLSPETVKGDRNGRLGAMDVWALGCVLLECATGNKPWSNLDNEWAIMWNIGIAVQHPPLPDNSQLSELGIDFIRQCLNIDPKERPTASDLMNHAWILDFKEKLGNAIYAEEMAKKEEFAQATVWKNSDPEEAKLSGDPLGGTLMWDEE